MHEQLDEHFLTRKMTSHIPYLQTALFRDPFQCERRGSLIYQNLDGSSKDLLDSLRASWRSTGANKAEVHRNFIVFGFHHGLP